MVKTARFGYMIEFSIQISLGSAEKGHKTRFKQKIKVESRIRESKGLFLGVKTIP